MHANVPVQIRLMVEIDVHTPEGPARTAYVHWDPHEQNAAKRELLGRGLSGPYLSRLLAQWEKLCADLDDDRQETVPRPACDYVQERFDLANPVLQKELGFQVVVGEPCEAQIVVKLPDCGHEGFRCFELMRRVKKKRKLLPWELVSSRGVRAHVMVGLGWSNPAVTAAPAVPAMPTMQAGNGAVPVEQAADDGHGRRRERGLARTVGRR